MNIKEWGERSTVPTLDMSTCEFWVQIKDVPFAVQKKKNIVKMGATVGKCLYYEEPKQAGICFRDFVRVRVAVDLAKPLVTGLWLPTPEGVKMWAAVKYEKLKGFCYRCGIIGHSEEDCAKPYKMAAHNPREQKYSKELEENPRKLVTHICRYSEDMGETVEVSMRKETSSSKLSKEDSKLGHPLGYQIPGNKDARNKGKQIESEPEGCDQMEISESMQISDSYVMEELRFEEDEVNSPAKRKGKEKIGEERQPKVMEVEETPGGNILEVVAPTTQGLVRVQMVR